MQRPNDNMQKEKREADLPTPQVYYLFSWTNNGGDDTLVLRNSFSPVRLLVHLAQDSVLNNCA